MTRPLTTKWTEQDFHKPVHLDHVPTKDNFKFAVYIADVINPSTGFKRHLMGRYSFYFGIALFSRYIIAPPMWSLQITIKTDISETHTFNLRAELGVNMLFLTPFICSLIIDPCVGVNISSRLVAFSNNEWVIIDVGSLNLKPAAFFKLVPQSKWKLPLGLFRPECQDMQEDINKMLGENVARPNCNEWTEGHGFEYEIPLPTGLSAHQVWSIIHGDCAYCDKPFKVSNFVEDVHYSRDEFSSRYGGKRKYQLKTKERNLNIAIGGRNFQLNLDAGVKRLKIRCHDSNLLHIVKDVVCAQLKDKKDTVVVDAIRFYTEIQLHQMKSQESYNSASLSKKRDEWRKITSKLPL